MKVPLLKEDSDRGTEFPGKVRRLEKSLIADQMLAQPHLTVGFTRKSELRLALRVVPHHQAFDLAGLQRERDIGQISTTRVIRQRDMEGVLLIEIKTR